MEGDEEKAGIFLWTITRTRSSAFFTTLYNRPRTKCFFEPYCEPYYKGPERIHEPLENHTIDETLTYDKLTKRLLDSFSPDIDVVFVKDFSYHLTHKYGKDTMSYLPSSFKHSFLIRTPYKTVTSGYRVAMDPNVKAYKYEDFADRPNRYKDLYEFFEMVHDHMGEDPVVIDGDDFAENPEGMLHVYCEKMGIKYHDSMLNWTCDPKTMDITHNWEAGWFSKLFNSNTIITAPKSSYDMTSLEKEIDEMPDVVKKEIEQSLPYYEKMYALRLQAKKHK